MDVVNGTFDIDGGGATMVSALLWSSCADLMEESISIWGVTGPRERLNTMVVIVYLSPLPS